MPRAARQFATDVRYSLLMYYRNRQALFFSFVFPALFLVMLGYLLGGPGSGPGPVADLLPGIVSLCILFSAINGTAGSLAKYKVNGTFKKLSTTPLSSYLLNVSRIASGTIIVVLSSALSLLVAWLVFGVAPALTPVSALVVVVGSVTFAGVGMVVAYLIEDPDAVSAAAYVVILPLVLVSGSFFPVARLPVLLRMVSILSPLTYLNNGIRSSMFAAQPGTALVNMGICVFLCFMVFCIGVAIQASRES